MKLKQLFESPNYDSYDYDEEEDHEEGYTYEVTLQRVPDEFDWNAFEEFTNEVDERGLDRIRRSKGLSEEEFRSKYYKRAFPDRDYMVPKKALLNSLGKTVVVPIDKLYALERRLSPEHLDKIRRGESVKSSSGLPRVYNYNGMLIIGDGNHRVEAAKLSGKDEIRIQLMNP